MWFIIGPLFKCSHTLTNPNPDPSYLRNAGCIASPARGRKGLKTFARFLCVFGIVVINPQVLFDKITDLIVETFINEDVNVEQNEIEEFREKGIISVAMMKKISESSSKGVQLPFK